MEQVAQPRRRLVSIDAYRGFVMFLLLGEMFRFDTLAKAFPENSFFKFLALNQSHVEWLGCTLHDLIQPSFSFLVGVSLAFSLAARSTLQSPLRIALHAFWRAFVLIALGIFLRSKNGFQTNYTFEDTLTQIGLGYGFLYLLSRTSIRIQVLALVLILVGYWSLFATYPLPGENFDWSKTGVKPDWSHNLSGFEAHWNKNTNPAWAFDVWFLNLFPRAKPFLYNGGGYATLSFIPTLATMLLGLLAGQLIRMEMSEWKKVGWLILAAIGSLAIGWGLEKAGVCPIVKRIWTSSWVLYSGGWCFLFMAVFQALCEAARFHRWAFPLVEIGSNAIAAYVMDGLIASWISAAWRRHMGTENLRIFGLEYESFFLGTLSILTLWLILFWMYRRKLFIKI
ncbi:hypothetical protein KIH39_06225 [Telmatocola sphagniphila]|uniref:DUF5009 domain-containing protein n=1 Tax=Telmatocola sphagniphila TaxID=1123043 RepID=A0A8E6B904_9BACT|nr:hypothetical protein [Telmatocola sphagniphila]QVL33504.1 hypothetical protein KIH39_06225 [Telmatocola sphagniphila]